MKVGAERQREYRSAAHHRWRLVASAFDTRCMAPCGRCAAGGFLACGMCRAPPIPMNTLRDRTSLRLPLLAAGVAALLGLSACYVVPIDPRTGQAYPVTPRESGGGVTVLTPPAAPAPPQPSVLQVRLYPLNQQANQGGLLTPVVVDSHTGHASFTLAYLADNLH